MESIELGGEWEKDSDHESAYTNNMVTRDVIAYRKGDRVLIMTKTKVTPGWIVELYKTPNKILIKHKSKVKSDELEETAEEMINEAE